MGALELLPTLLASFTIGILIGAAGVGEVLLAPWLTHVAGLTVQQAIGIAMLSFMGPGLVALLSIRRPPAAPAQPIWTMVVATVPGALAGAAVLAYLPERATLVLLAFAVSLIGFRLLRVPTPIAEHSSASPAIAGGIPTGLFVGFGSAVTVTSGPMVLTPWLLWRGGALPDAIALGQLVQFPIAASATVGNLLAGPVEMAAGIGIGIVLVPGMLLGRRMGMVLPRPLLGRTVGILLLVPGGAFFAKALR